MLTFAEALSREMVVYKHSAIDSARLSGLARSTISHYMAGTRRPDMHALAVLMCVYPRLLIWFVLYAESVITARERAAE